MKKLNLTILLLALLLPMFSYAQGWEKTFNGGQDERAWASDRTLDGGVIMAGTQIDDANDIEYSFLYKTDIDGNLQWAFYDSIHASNFVNTMEVFSTSDGNYLLSSIYGSTAPNNSYVLQKIAPGGSVLWENDLNTFSNLDFVTDIAEASGGGYLLMGAYSNSMGFNSTGIVKIDSDGNLIWERGFEGIDEPVYYGTVIETANQDVVVTGYAGYFNDTQNTFVNRLDSSGNIIWEKEYDRMDSQFGLELAELASGEIVIGGMTAGDFSPYYATLQKIDADGNELWYQVYLSLGHQQLGGMQPTADGGFALAGYTSTFSSGDNDFYLMKTDASGNELWTKTYGRSKEDVCTEILLSSDQGFYLAGYTQKTDNSEDVYLIKTDSLGKLFTNTLSGNLFLDENFDCILDPSEEGAEQWLIELEKGEAHYATLTDSMGNYSFSLDSGNYEMSVFTVSPYWALCDTFYNINFTGFNETITQDVGVQVLISCPLLDVSIGTPFLRRCFESTYSVQYCNYGTTTAEDAYVEVTLDPAMIFVNSGLPVASQNGNTYTFDLGDVPVGDCGSFSIDVLLGDSTTCDSVPLGATHCVVAHIYPDSICLPNNSWSGASIEVDAICQGDSIVFSIQNVGSASTQSNLQYIVVEDDVILFNGNFDLNPNEVYNITIPTNGATFRLEAEQEPNHPGMSMPSVSVEGCGSPNTIFTFGFVNIFAGDDGDPFVDIDCRVNIGAYDPNDKQGFPLGYGTENYIDRGQDIEYLIRFQNTGTDTAFNIVVRDTLSEFLDVRSIRPGASSHPYDFNISGNGALSFTFDNIMLPDSNVNESASNGFVKFKVAQKSNLDLETKIYNTAAIYFDFNAPIFTNQTLHTIGENFITVSIAPVDNSLAAVKVFPNPFSTFANIEIEGVEIKDAEFKLFDINGRMLRKAIFDSNNFVFDKKDLQSGMYFFTIENNGALVASGKLIAQ